jgi:glutathione synthase/RimK-type ligase-like ATP-grasp enzyme
VIVQQYVHSDHELRVFVVGERLISYRVDKLDPAQLWVNPDAVEVRAVDIPPALGDALLALARFWRLDVAAFDLLVAGGEPVFLEVNINCDWRWFERRSDEPAVSSAVASWVASRFAQLRQA